MKLKIGELLIQYGIITELQLAEALSVQKANKKRLGEILLELGYLTSSDLILVLSEQADIPFVEVNLEMLDQNLMHQFPKKVLYKNTVLPLYETEDTVFIAQGDPTDKDKTGAIQAHTPKKITVSGADPEKIIHLLDKFFLTQQDRVMPKKREQNVIRITAQNAHIKWLSKTDELKHVHGKIDITIKYSDTRDKK